MTCTPTAGAALRMPMDIGRCNRVHLVHRSTVDTGTTVSRDDVIFVDRLLLNRSPESETVIAHHARADDLRSAGGLPEQPGL